jgi:hypothetical protein
MQNNPLGKAVVVVGAAAVATLAPLALVSSAASATSGTATGTTIAGRTSVATGQAVTFTAAVAPSTPTPGPKPTGTVAFTITGHDGSNVDCSGGDSATVTKGKARCTVAAGSLTAAASAYSVAAVYSGDSTYAGSTATPISVTVGKASIQVRLAVTPKPTSDTSSTFTATIEAGKSGSQATGSVLFAMSVSHGKNKRKYKTCQGAGGDAQPVSSGVATCTLPAGWFIVPAPTKTDPHPIGRWNVTASYSGDSNFSASGKPASISGSSKT